MVVEGDEEGVTAEKGRERVKVEETEREEGEEGMKRDIVAEV